MPNICPDLDKAIAALGWLPHLDITGRNVRFWTPHPPTSRFPASPLRDPGRGHVIAPRYVLPLRRLRRLPTRHLVAPDGKRKGKDAAVAELASNVDRAAMRLDDAARDGEAESDPAAVSALRLPELAGQPRDLRCGYSWSRIAYREVHRAIGSAPGVVAHAD